MKIGPLPRQLVGVLLFSMAARTAAATGPRSVGLSRNLRNNAIYDRRWDWVLSGSSDGRTRIEPGQVEPNRITFSWQSRGPTVELVFRPRFYQKHKDNPFFLMLTFTIPHAELAAPEDSMKLYEGIEETKPWGNIKAHYRIERKSYGLYNACEKPRQTFAAMVSRLDRDVGRLLDLLGELKIDEETLVMFSSDNGPHFEGGADPPFFRSSGPPRGGKRSLHEGGIRVPFIARQPGRIQAGATSDHPSAFWDLMPTLCELIGVEPDSNRDAVQGVRAAIEACAGQLPATLVFPKGRYDFQAEHSEQIDYFESNTTDNNPKTCPIVLRRIKGLTIEGNGSEFIFHGLLAMQAGKTDLAENDGKMKKTAVLAAMVMTWEGFQELAADRKAKGFSVVQIVCGPYPDEDAFEEMWANEGGLPYHTRDYEEINVRYWDYADRRLAHLVDVALVPAIVGAWGRHDCDAMKVAGVEGLKRHWRYVIARYGAYPVCWILAGELQNDSKWGMGPWGEVGRYVRRIDPYQRPITNHTGGGRRGDPNDDLVITYDMVGTA